MSNHIELGKIGEDLAEKFLQKKGFQILLRNYRYKHLELDIICLDKGDLVIVEVKTRTTNKLGEPEMISRAKQKQVIRGANFYIHEYNRTENVRFDVVGIILNQYQTDIRHIEDAFIPLL